MLSHVSHPPPRPSPADEAKAALVARRENAISNKNRAARRSESKAKVIGNPLRFNREKRDLPDGSYTGTIRDARLNDEETAVFLKIPLEGTRIIFATRLRLSQSDTDFSPLDEPLAELADYLGRDACLEDLIGLGIEFEVYHREKDGEVFCNLKNIGLYADEESDTKTNASGVEAEEPSAVVEEPEEPDEDEDEDEDEADEYDDDDDDDNESFANFFDEDDDDE